MGSSRPSELKMRTSISCFHFRHRYIVFPSVRTLTDSLLGVYRPDFPKWDSISSLVETLGWANVVNSTAADFFAGHGISETYIFELIQAATRVNYAQNTDEINGWSGSVSMAAKGARSIVGGNKQIFEQFLNRSGANVYLSTKVSRSG